MFSYLLVALFALLSLSVSSLPLPRALSYSEPCDLPTTTPSVVIPTYTPVPTTDDCSNTTYSAPTSTPVPFTSVASTPTTSLTPVVSTPTTSTPVASTPATSSAPVPTAIVATVSDALLNTGGIATYYYQNGNAGACGWYNSDSAIICAMNSVRFSPSLCGQQVSVINAQTGRSITVTIADECPTCQNDNSIDFSVGAFQALGGSLSQGEFPIEWSFA